VSNYGEEPDFYSEPTAAARYGGYDAGYSGGSKPPEPEPPTPWYRRPVALVIAGAIGVILLGCVVFTIVKLTGGSSAPSTTTPSPTLTTAVTTEAPHHHGPGSSAPPQTVTETPSVSDTGTPSTSDTSTSTTPPSTVTETSTVTESPSRRPFNPRQ
jgi:cytoskeletal protein RodZ